MSTCTACHQQRNQQHFSELTLFLYGSPKCETTISIPQLEDSNANAPIFVPDLGLDLIDSITAVNLKSNCFPSQILYEDLHRAGGTR